MEEEKVKAAEEEETWSKETVPKVIRIVSTRLSQRDIISLLLVSPWLHRTLVSYPSLWLVIDLREMNNAGNRLVSALSIPRYRHVREINLEFAQDIEDRHLELLKTKCLGSLQDLESLNLNGCQKISDKGIEIISSTCPELKVFSIYWNVRVTDIGIQHLVKNCKHIIDLNLSGCKNILDKSLQLIADNYQELESLNLTRYVHMILLGLFYIWSNNILLMSEFIYHGIRFFQAVQINSSNGGDHLAFAYIIETNTYKHGKEKHIIETIKTGQQLL